MPSVDSQPAAEAPAPPPTAWKNFWGDMPEDEYYASQGVRNRQSYFSTPQGHRLFTQSFEPVGADGELLPVKASVYMTHGYGSDAGWLFQKIAISYARWGYAVFCADLLGHGRSDGVRCYLGDLEGVAAASLSFFLHTRRSEPFKDLPAFLFGESMGGAATMLMYFQSKDSPGGCPWTGLIFSAPLFVMPEEMKPSRWRLRPRRRSEADERAGEEATTQVLRMGNRRPSPGAASPLGSSSLQVHPNPEPRGLGDFVRVLRQPWGFEVPRGLPIIRPSILLSALGLSPMVVVDGSPVLGLGGINSLCAMQSFAPRSGSGWWTSRTSVTNGGDVSVFFLKLPSLRQQVAPRSRRLLIFSRLGRQPKRRNTLREKLLTRSDQVRKILDAITPELQPENAQPRLSRRADEQTGGVNTGPSDANSMRDGSRNQNDEESVYNQDARGKRELASESVLWNKLETWVDQYKKDSDVWGIGSAPIFTIYKDPDGNVVRVSLNEDEIIRRSQGGTLSLQREELREDYMDVNAKVSRAKHIAKEIESGKYELPENSTVAQTVVERVRSSSSFDRFHFLNPGGKALVVISPRIVLPFLFSCFVIWSLKKLLFTNIRMEITKEEKEMLRRKLKSRMERGKIEQGSVEVINNIPELPVGSERRPPLDKLELMKNIKAKTSTEGARISDSQVDFDDDDVNFKDHVYEIREMVKQVHELEQEEKQHVGKRTDESDPFSLPSTDHQLPGLQSNMGLEMHHMENYSDGSSTSQHNILTEQIETTKIAGPMDGSFVGSLGNIPGEKSGVKNFESLQSETVDYPEIGAVASVNQIAVDIPASKMEDSSRSLDEDASRNEEIGHKTPSIDLITPQDDRGIQFGQTRSDHSSSMGKKTTGIKPKVLVSKKEARDYLKKKKSSSTDKLQSRLSTQDNCRSASFLSNGSSKTIIERMEGVKSAEVELTDGTTDRTLAPDFSSHMVLDHVQDRADSKHINKPSSIDAVGVLSSVDAEKSDAGNTYGLSPENADGDALQSSVTRHFEREEVAARKGTDDSGELYEPNLSDFRNEDQPHKEQQVERPKDYSDVNSPLHSSAEFSEKSQDNDRQTEAKQVKDEKSWVEKNFEEFDPIIKKIGVGFQENYLSAREKTKEQKVLSAGIGEIALEDEEFEWMNDENLREIVFKVRDNELAGREPFHLMDADEKVAFFEGLERKVERENNRMSALHEFIHTKIENIDYGIDGVSLHDPIEKIVPRWKGPPLSEDPEFLNNFARGRQETLKSKMASEDMEDLQISDKTQSHALSPSSPIHNLRKTSSDGASISPRTIIESSDGSSRSGKKLGKEHWEHTKKWSREFLELYNAETDPEVKSIMRDMGKDLDKWITEKEVQDVADLMTRIPKRKRRFIEKKMDKLKREIETFGHQAVVSKYKEYLDENEDDYLWWLDLRFVLCIELYRVEDDVPKIGFYSLEMAADLELDPKQYHVIAFEDAGDSKNFCHIIQAHMEMLGNGSAFVVARPPKDAFREAKANGFHVTVIRKGELKLNIDQTLEEVEEEITEIGSKMYHDKIMRERGIDMGSLMKGVINADKSPKRKSAPLLERPTARKTPLA